MTTINTEGRSEPLERALRRARIAALAGGTDDVQGMSTPALEARKRQIEHYKMLKRIDDLTRREYLVRDGGRIHTT